MEISADTLRNLQAYAEGITGHAFKILKEHNPYPNTGSRTELRVAYAQGLFDARALTLPLLKEKIATIAFCLHQAMLTLPAIPDQYLGAYVISQIRKHSTTTKAVLRLTKGDKDLAENMAYWRSYHDAYVFAVCFATRGTGDYPPAIRKMVERSLAGESLLEAWQGTGTMIYADFPRLRYDFIEQGKRLNHASLR